MLCVLLITEMLTFAAFSPSDISIQHVTEYPICSIILLFFSSCTPEVKESLKSPWVLLHEAVTFSSLN